MGFGFVGCFRVGLGCGFGVFLGSSVWFFVLFLRRAVLNLKFLINSLALQSTQGDHLLE